MEIKMIRPGNLKVGPLRGTEEDLDDLCVKLKRKGGLINPVVTDSELKVISGNRRVHAAKKLGWQFIPVYVDATLKELLKALEAERDANYQLALRPSEKKKLADRIRELLKPQARGRQATSTGGTDPRPASGKLPEAGENGPETQENDENEGSGEVNEEAAKAVGMSRKTLEKIDEVMNAAAADPERYGDLAAVLDDEGKVDPAYKELLKRKKEAEEAENPLGSAAADYCTTINQYTHRIDTWLSEFNDLKASPLGHDIHWPTVFSQLTAVRKALHQGRPKRPCPYCKATGKKGVGNCGSCKGSGHVCESIYKSGCAAVGIPFEKAADE